ncbi:MAG: hypothetical protein II629_02160 [Ruminococcus sp.]|nr:hypothetical protein [Ruminococcus sp.]
MNRLPAAHTKACPGYRHNRCRNDERFAALVISDLKAGDLRDALLNGGDMLIVGEADPLHMTSEQRKAQKTYVVSLPGKE